MDDNATDDSATDDDATDDNAMDDNVMDDNAMDDNVMDHNAMDDNGIPVDQAFVEFVIKQIVEEPDEVEIERTVDEMGVLITLKVGKDDMGKIIGKGGQTAKALRILLRIIGSKNNARVNLKIVEPEEM